MQRDVQRQLLGELTEQVTHDLANRLAVARLTAEVLARRRDLPAGVAEAVDSLARATAEAGDVVQQLAAVAGRRPGPTHELDLAAVVSAMEPLLVAGLGRRQLRTVLAPSVVTADRRDIEEALVRLVLGGHHGTGEVVIAVATAGDEAVLTVRRPEDDPLPEEGMDRAGQLLARAGGSLVRSPGRLEARLPVAGAPAGSTGAAAAGGAVVLVVEDDPDLRGLVLEALAADGHDVHAVSDADAARRHPSVVAGQLDLLITDVELPGSSGVTLAAELAPAGARVLVMSGHGAAALAGRLPAGAHVLDKPFGVPDLLARARAALG